MQLDDLGGDMLQEPMDAANLADTGQKDQYVTLGLLYQSSLNGVSNCTFPGLSSLGRAPENVDRQDPAFGSNHRCVAKQLGTSSGIECGRHHQKAQVGSHQRSGFDTARQSEIGIDRTLVILIENHCAYIGK